MASKRKTVKRPMRLIKAAARLDAYLSGEAAPQGDVFFSYNTIPAGPIFDACFLAEEWMREHPKEMKKARDLIAKAKLKDKSHAR